jgi:hypothetical protein
VRASASLDATVSRQDPGWLRRWWPMFTALAGLMLVCGFGAPEAVAVWNPGVGGTYTESIQDWLGVGQGQTTVGWVVLTALLAGFAIWFPVHLRNGWPWERAQSRKPDKID